MSNYKFVAILGNAASDDKDSESKAFTVDLTDPESFSNVNLSGEFIQIMIDSALNEDKTPLEEHLNRLRLAYTFFNCRNAENPSKYAVVTVSSSARLCVGMYFGWEEIKALFDEVNASGCELDEGTFNMLNDVRPCVVWKITKREKISNAVSDAINVDEITSLQLVKWDPDDKSPFPQKFEDIPRTLS